MSDQQQLHEHYHDAPATRLTLPQHVRGRPGPETGSTEIQLLRNSCSTHSRDNYTKKLSRSAEPDDDLNAQPAQQNRHGYGDSGGMLQENGEFVSDNATIVSQRSVADSATIASQRSAANTVDTDAKTLQIGSLSQKPSPDDPGTQPYIHAHADNMNGRIGQPRNEDLLGTVPPETMGGLSFPSPPLVQEDEAVLPRRPGSGDFSDILKSYNTETSEGQAAFTLFGIGANAPTEVEVIESDTNQHRSPKRRRFCIGMVVAIVVVIATVVIALVVMDQQNSANPTGNRVIVDESQDMTHSPTVAPFKMRTSAPTKDNFNNDGGVLLSSPNPTESNRTTTNEVTESVVVPSPMPSLPELKAGDAVAVTQPAETPTVSSMLRPTSRPSVSQPESKPPTVW